MKKTVLIIGANGEIGVALQEHLARDYRIISSDINENIHHFPDYHRIDAANRDEVVSLFQKEKIDAVVNLAGLPEMEDIPGDEMVEQMINCYFKIPYTLLAAMEKFGVTKFVLASSNHVTGFYEKNGYSSLDREIRSDDYPISISVYGTLKLAAENLCRNYYINCGINTICLRIGSYRRSEEIMTERWTRTILYTKDMVSYFRGAIETDIGFGIYYAVSENPDKPWYTEDAKRDLKI